MGVTPPRSPSSLSLLALPPRPPSSPSLLAHPTLAPFREAHNGPLPSASLPPQVRFCLFLSREAHSIPLLSASLHPQAHFCLFPCSEAHHSVLSSASLHQFLRFYIFPCSDAYPSVSSSASQIPCVSCPVPVLPSLLVPVPHVAKPTAVLSCPLHRLRASLALFPSFRLCLSPFREAHSRPLLSASLLLCRSHRVCVRPFLHVPMQRGPQPRPLVRFAASAGPFLCVSVPRNLSKRLLSASLLSFACFARYLYREAHHRVSRTASLLPGFTIQGFRRFFIKIA